VNQSKCLFFGSGLWLGMNQWDEGEGETGGTNPLIQFMHLLFSGGIRLTR
jgi:hypothetical protein